MTIRNGTQQWTSKLLTHNPTILIQLLHNVKTTNSRPVNKLLQKSNSLQKTEFQQEFIHDFQISVHGSQFEDKSEFCQKKKYEFESLKIILVVHSM